MANWEEFGLEPNDNDSSGIACGFVKQPTWQVSGVFNNMFQRTVDTVDDSSMTWVLGGWELQSMGVGTRWV